MSESQPGAQAVPVWVLVGMSCRDCNTDGVLVLDHEPADEDTRSLKEALGGMWCISVRPVQALVNGPSVLCEPRE